MGRAQRRARAPLCTQPPALKIGCSAWLAIRSPSGGAAPLAHSRTLSRPPDVLLTRFWEYGLPPLVVRPEVVTTPNTVPSTLARLEAQNYAAAPLAAWDPRYQLNRIVRAAARRRDVLAYQRAVARLCDQYGAPTDTAAPTFSHARNQQGQARFLGAGER